MIFYRSIVILLTEMLNAVIINNRQIPRKKPMYFLSYGNKVHVESQRTFEKGISSRHGGEADRRRIA